MSIIIDREKCAGCRKCAAICPGSLIAMGGDGKATMKYPKDCWACASCVKECIYDAISLYLGVDIGGAGSTVSVVEDGDTVHWKIMDSNGETTVINVNRKDPNNY